MSNFLIKASYTAVTPINVNEPGSSMKKNGSNFTPIPKVWVGDVQHACIPASSVRGTFRRCAAKVVSQKVIEANGGEPQWSLKEFYWNLIGGVRLSKDDADNEEFKNISDVAPFTLVESVRRRNPIIGLFGTFDPVAIAGHIQIGNAICDAPVKITEYQNKLDDRSGIRSEPLRRSPEIAVVLNEDGLDEWEAMTEKGRRRMSMDGRAKELERERARARKNGQPVDDFDKQLKEIKDQRDALIKDEGGSVSIQQVLGNVEYIPQGASLSQRIRIMNTNDIEMGLFFAMLINFSGESMFGGKRNLGAGEVAGKWIITDLFDRGNVCAVVEASLEGGFNVIEGREFVDAKLLAWEEFSSSPEFKTHYPTKEELKLAV